MRILQFLPFANLAMHERVRLLVQAVRLDEEAMTKILGITHISVRAILATGIPRGPHHYDQLHRVDRLVYVIKYALRLTNYNMDKAAELWTAENYFWGYEPKPPWAKEGIHAFLLAGGPEKLKEVCEWIRQYG